MFKVGDKVICKNSDVTYNYFLIENYSYIVSNVDIQYGIVNYIVVKESNEYFINVNNFITLEEDRRILLLKLKKNICLKKVIY
jgi:hypothetical protein